ncbi:unnamed protein product [Clonostachys rosea f. rosea IK726]|uniref:Uncharacterized protein n=1 Tax=Clonostachys rosea f. rosea IK726 TaxID=1349383 RepID=A0ACA9UCN1_BIOOC|nr:unnamed protein product [Clonostachys rosea f. rosea IK726]
MMAVGSTLRAPLIHLWVLLCLPWALSNFLFDATLCLVPWTRPSQKWSLNQAIRIRVVRLLLLYWSVTKAGDRLHLCQGREKNRFEVIAPRPLESYRGALADTAIQPMQLGMTWTPSRPPPAALVGPDIVVALHFHGGGFVIGNGRDEDTGYLAQTLIRHMGCTHVCTPQYRLSSGKNGQFPAPIQDALTAYLCLLKTKGIPASQIILSGDSAGANMALALVRYIHQHGQLDKIPLPKAVTLWSPWVDVGGALEQDLTRSPNYKTDYLNRQFGTWGASTISAYGSIDPSGPYLSPLRHPFQLKSSLPMYVNAGEREVLCDDIKEFCQRYRKHGWLVHLDISEGCPHDILLLGPRVGFGAEAEEAARCAKDFLSENAGVNLGGYSRKGAL